MNKHTHETIRDAVDEHVHYKDNHTIPEGLRMYAGHAVADASGTECEWSQDEAIYRLQTVTERELLAGLRVTKHRYPAIYKCCERFFSQLEESLSPSETTSTENCHFATTVLDEATIKRNQDMMWAAEYRRQQRNAQRRGAVWRSARKITKVGIVALLILATPFAFRSYEKHKETEKARLAEVQREEQARLEQEKQKELANIKKLKAKARKGDVKAQFTLGEIYLNGTKHITSDVPIAIGWFEKAAYRNNSEAQKKLFDIYYDGQYVPQNMKKAVQWLKTLSKRGDSDALVKLGDIYRSGAGGVPIDISEAQKWYRMAAVRGNKEAHEKLVHLESLVVAVVPAAMPLPDEERPQAPTEWAGSSDVNKAEITGISRTEIEQFIQTFLRATDDHDLNRILTHYAERVNYFGWGDVNRAAVRGDKINHFRRWNEINSNLASDIRITDVPGYPDRRSVNFNFEFHVKNQKKSVRGTAENTWIIQKTDDGIRIVDEKQTVLKRDTQDY